MSEASISVLDSKSLLPLFGPRDQYLRIIRDTLGVQIAARENEIFIRGDDQRVAQATEVFHRLKDRLERAGNLDGDAVAHVLASVCGGNGAQHPKVIEVFSAANQVRPRTPGQERLVDAIRAHDVVFCVGPAGTGKTYLAVAMAAAALKAEQVRKIILVRPAVEAGENLGYLPGDMQAKINPYLRPLLDALREMMDFEQIKRYTERDLIEVIPLAYMRGRTLNEAFMILDEAQNTTVGQMKMFLTRMGRKSKIVVSGDTSQVDLPPHVKSGLVDASHRLRGIDGIAHVALANEDIVRHKLVQDIVRAYEEGASRRR